MLRKLELDFVASIADKSNCTNGGKGYMNIQPMFLPALPLAIAQETSSTLFQESIPKHPEKAERLNGKGSNICSSAPTDPQHLFSQPVIDIYYSSSSSNGIDYIVDFSRASKECSYVTSHESDHHDTPTTGSLRSSELAEKYPECKIRNFFNPFIDSFYNDSVPVVHVSNLNNVVFDTSK